MIALATIRALGLQRAISVRPEQRWLALGVTSAYNDLGAQ